MISKELLIRSFTALKNLRSSPESRHLFLLILMLFRIILNNFVEHIKSKTENHGIYTSTRGNGP
jgi:hypothetical protein